MTPTGGQGATLGAPPATVAPVTYRLQMKALDPALDDTSVEDQHAAEDATDARQWSGEPYEAPDAPEGPDGAHSVFSHPGGETAWLDRDETGVLTGWVLGSDGVLYRYTDADAWAVDVDDAGMAEVDQAGAEEVDPGEDEGEGEEDPDDAAAADPFTEEAAPTDDALPGEDDTWDDAELSEFPDEPDAMVDTDTEDDPDDDDDEDDPESRFRRGSEGKYLMTVTRR